MCKSCNTCILTYHIALFFSVRPCDSTIKLINLSVCICLCLSVSVRICLSVSVSVCICLYLCVSGATFIPVFDPVLGALWNGTGVLAFKWKDCEMIIRSMFCPLRFSLKSSTSVINLFYVLWKIVPARCGG